MIHRDGGCGDLVQTAADFQDRVAHVEASDPDIIMRHDLEKDHDPGSDQYAGLTDTRY